MHTRCPECQTVFLITEQQLGAAGGKARCGRCGAVFDARAALLQKPGAAPTPEPPAEPATANESASESASQPAAATAAAPASAPADEAIPAVLLADFEEQARPVRRRHGWAWALLIVLLVATLGLQYTYFTRAELVNRFPQARPWLVQMCEVLAVAVECQVPYPSRLGQLRMLSSEVSAHPRQDRALLIHATFVNTAPFTQPFPLLEVMLTDLRGSPVALRRFKPSEYLREDIPVRDGMAPRTPVTALLEVAQPFADVNSYRFAFHHVTRKQDND